MTKKTVLLLTLSVAAAAYAFGRYAQPEKVVVKEVEVVKRDVKTVVRTVKQPDGTVIRERTTEDKTQTMSEKEKTVVNDKSKVTVNALLGYSFNDRKEIYGLMVQKQMFGPVSVGAFGMSDTTVGVTIGISF